MLHWRNGDLNRLSSEFKGRGAGGGRVITEILNDVADEAVDMMVGLIESTPSGIVPGKIGRVWTGRMRDAVARTPVVQDGTRYTVAFGWVNEFEKYFLWQEQGVTWGARDIPPMHALLRTFIWAREEVRQRLKDVTL